MTFFLSFMHANLYQSSNIQPIQKQKYVQKTRHFNVHTVLKNTNSLKAYYF
jgi:hypothetical protein